MLIAIFRRPDLFQSFLLLTFLWLPGSGYAADNLPLPVAAALRQANIPRQAVGLVVQAVNGREPMFDLNAQLAFSPASTMKLVTTEVALARLGPAYSWKTRVYASGSVTDGVLQGDLIFKGGGDPKLVIEKFWLLLRRIREAGIRDIRGSVVIDRSAFVRTDYDAAQFDGDPLKPYNAPPDAMLLNYEALRFTFFPDSAGGGTRVEVDPPLADYAIGSPALSHGGCNDWQSGLGAAFDAEGIRFTGSYPADCGNRTWYAYPYGMAPNRYFALVFKRMWTDLGGRFDGRVIDGNVPDDARVVTEWESPSLPEVIHDINKFSNNVMARQLLLTLAETDGAGVAGSEERGAQVVKDWLTGAGIAAPELVIENGSGLSRDERIAPGTMAQLLRAAFQSAWMPEFVASLPIAGYDGTMRRRLMERGVAGNAHIKTGTLDGVKAAAGYLQAASGKRYVVVFFVNHANAARAESAQDALLEWLYEHG